MKIVALAFIVLSIACNSPPPSAQRPPGAATPATALPAVASATPAPTSTSIPPEAVSATAEAKGLATAAAFGAQTATAFAKQQAADATAAAVLAVTATYEAQPVLTVKGIFTDWESRTDVQKPAYESSLPGRRIDDRGQVNNVYESGYVLLYYSNLRLGQGARLYDIPRSVLATLNKDQVVHFRGLVRKFSNSFGQTLDVDHTTIVP